MASVSIMQPNRSRSDSLLQGSALGSRFHVLFDSFDDRHRKNDKKKSKKKGKIKAKDKGKSKREKSPEKFESQPPSVELHGNSSAFGVYCGVRQAVMEQQIQQASQIYMSTIRPQANDAESDDELDNKIKDATLKIPKIVGIGLCGVFELIKETQTSHPALCTRALQALFCMLQGQHPESMKTEPPEVIDALFVLLMDLATVSGPNPGHRAASDSMTALACSCLLSLALARGDTGKILAALSSMLMSPAALATQQIKVPDILSSLQRSVQAVLLGRTQLPTWLGSGIPNKSKVDTFTIEQLTPLSDNEGSAIASDGSFLYIHNRDGLHKVGTGYGGTLKGHVYMMNPDFHPKEHGWLGFVKQLYYKSMNEVSDAVTVVKTDSLKEGGKVNLEVKKYGANVMFCDGAHIGHVAASWDDSFVVRTFHPNSIPMTLANELPLKLARRCLDVFGTAAFDAQVDIHSITTGFEEDANSIGACKEFAIIKTSSGKVLFTGKSQAVGIKQGGPAAGKWAELPVTKSPKMVQFSVGHEGSHALLVSEDGSVFFVGTPRRGEDGDGGVSKARRQPKAMKPKKMIKLEGKHVIQSSCNSGTSAVVTREGEMYMFGKDTTHCDHATGHVTDLKDIIVSHVTLGKAHAVVLTNKGHVYSFGINNKGQCGRDYIGGVCREFSTQVNMADEEEDADDDFMCPSGKHKWKQEQCMVCTNCGECTGYGSSCVSSGRPDRNPGLPCGCGSGDSGCTTCGVCRSCAGEVDADNKVAESPSGGGLLDILAKSKEVLPLDLFIGRYGARNFDQLNRKVDEKRHRVKAKLNRQKVKAVVEASGSDYEQDHVKMASLPPARVEIGRSDLTATHIVCGLQHTVVLLENGEVYTFGGNQHGQLGLGDTINRGTPTKVVLKPVVVQIAAGSNHTTLLTSGGQVYTFGNYQKGQLGRPAPKEDQVKEKRGLWHALPGSVPGIGAKHGRRATWIGASGDQTYMKIDESLINAHTLARSTIVANQSCIGLIPTVEQKASAIKCLMISKSDGSCKSFTGPEQAVLTHRSICLDPIYDVLWSYTGSIQEVSCYNIIASEARHLKSAHPSYCDLQSPTLAVPVQSSCQSTRSHCALHMLGCLDTLTTAHQLNMAVFEEEGEKHTTTKIYSKEDFSVVNRFESHGGGWGYSGHSIEAIRFMPDTDVILGGLGLFGGRGEYFGKIKIFDLGVDGGDNEIDGELLAETETTPYECGAREKYAMLFEDPVLLQANHWYVSWARISGPSSDCGSSGHSSVTTEDQVVFKFKSSKKSNNGTDVNAGQIPQLLYRLPTHSNNIGNRKNDFVEPAHVLSKQFFLTVSPVSKAKQSVLLGIGVKLIKECFESLLRLLKWSWNTFYAMIGDVHGAKGTSLMAAMFDLDRLVYICTGSLRLIKTYICELYPTQVNPKRVQSDNTQLVNCVADTRTVLCKILAESKRHLEVTGRPRNCEKLWFEKLAGRILEECHKTFTSCFHAFYPTDALKWTSLCSLLNWLDPMEKHLEGSGRLLAAVLEALCHPTVKLNNMVPANLESDSRWLLKRHQDSEGNTDICTINTDDNNTATTVVSDHTQFPLLVAHMVRTLEAEGADVGHWTFRQVLDKLLYIVVLPVQQLLQKEKVHLPSCLIANTCGLLASIVSELAASATGAEVDLSGTTRPLVATPNRYTRTSQSALWNTGNGSPDAVCFSVDRPGIIISGICVYGGGSQFDYEVEIMDDQSNTSNDPSHMGRWNTLEFVKGTFGAEDCVGDIAEIHFDRPVPIKENTKYAIRLRNRGPRTLNGDGGSNKVKCADGTTFTFSACSLSSNGTNHTRGQIPQMLYYSSPQDGEGNIQSSRAMAEFQARKNAISIATAIFRAATDLLLRARSTSDQKMADVIGSSQLFSNLLPLVMAYIGPVAAMDPRGAVQVLGLVQEILPAVSELNSRHWTQLAVPPSVPLNGGENSQQGDGNTTSQHYAIVESDHPYKPATVANYKVTFPPEVQWMGLEFDPQCSTAQSEDALQLYIPASHAPALFNCSTTKQGNEEREQRWWPVLSKYSGNHNWPTMAIVLPGNELCFSLETASDYVKDDKASFYGFKCTVVGYEWDAKPEEGLAQLEKEIAYLGGMCAASLMKRDIPLPPTTPEEAEEDLEQIEEGAQQIFQEHQNLLSKGFALCHPPSITQALEGSLPFCCNSNERTFLKDFVMCNTGTSGGRLAAWLQPEPYLDPKQCDILYNKDELRASWPTVITVQTKDQYGRLVNVPNLKVELKAVPVTQDSSGSEIRVKRLSQYDTESNLAFGGHPPPRLDTPYQVTIRDRKDAYHAISMMKVYDNYSFEELRYAAPAVQRPSENMLVRANNDGTCSASWTPGSLGCYNIHVTLDDYEAGEPFKVEVKEPPQGVTPPVQYNAKKPEHQPNKMRKFVAQWSSGLRIRINPSLQSEQIGIIKVNGIISFTDEIHNNDGVWLRLTEESTKKWCQPVNGYTEAWALQYNQHLGKTLLVPVEQPRSILDEIIKETILRRLPEIIRDKNKDKKSGPGVYQVVKCGSSGHNIRSRPGLKATPVGMMVLGNQLTATEALVNMEGAWVKLDQDSLQRYCHEIEGEAWSLAVGSDDIVFLQHEADVQELSETERKSAFGGDGGGGDATKGFDFTSAQQETPSLAAFGSSQVPSFGSDTGSAKECKGPITFGQSECSSFDEPFQSMTWPMDKAEACASGVSSRGGRDKSRHLSARTSYSSLDSSQSSLSPRSISPRLAPSLQSYKSADKKDLILLRDMPPELQGVSVKDLVKALGKIKLESQLSKAVKGRCGKPSNKSEWPSGGLLEAELKGVSIKDIIRLLGESRVNGNGATPPRTPPGTPKKTLSRSSSPKPIPGSPRTDISLSPRSDSPLLVVLPVPGRSSPSRTPPRTPPTPRRDSSSGVYTTPPQTPPTLRKTYSAGASPRLESPSRSRTQRSASCSPQRSGSPLGFLSRPGSSGLGKSSGASGGTAASSALSHAEPIKGHFSIGASSPREDPRQSPKPSRKDRSRQLRTKKERAGSPGQRVTTCRPRSGSAEIVREPVREALSPSVAQSLRAVFAAFMWHEGIVHDAMACASFLKFHPNLPKELSKVAIEKDVPSCSGNANGTGSGKGTPRVTPKTTPSGTLKKQHRQGMELTNINIIEAVKKLEFVRGKERHYSESRASEIDDSPTSTKPEERDSELPATLQHLVYFWEDLSSSTLKVVTQNMILPSPAVNVRVHKPDKKEKDRDKDKKGKKKKDLKYGGIAGRGNLFGEAALLGVGGERETLCELCGGMFPHPVTYHMRQAHLGCGRHAGGQGYNSGGNFCGGWAGNCGDGGVGGSTWYLMCDRCRDKYLSDKRQGVKDKSKKVKKKASSNKSSVTSQNLEPHLVMKNNAMFLLDLSSSAGMSLPSKTQHKQAVKLDMLPSVSEDSHSAQSPFPRVPFLYLFLRGAQAADSAFAEDVIFSDKEPSKGLSRSGHFERSQTQDGHSPRIMRSGSVGNDSKDQKGLNPTASKSAEVSPCDGEAAVSCGKQVLFQRSISEITGGSSSPGSQEEADEVGKVSGRKRNNSGGTADAGTSLLKHPSVAMARLIQCVERAGRAGVADKTLQRPVLAFVIQRHDLDALLLAMRQSLRKAACRIFALQSFNWLMRNVTQSSCLHDLLWHFVGSVTPPSDEAAEIENDKVNKKDKKDIEQEKDVVMCQHPLVDISIAGEAANPLPQVFHTFLQTISDVMMYLPPGSALQQMAVRCWCLKFKPSDLMFLHKSHVFSNISKILSKSDEGWGVSAADNAHVISKVECLKDVTQWIDLKASSRQAMIGSLTDNSTETFWESGEEDHNRTKSITLTCRSDHRPCMVYVHVDNTRDLGNKVSYIVFNAGSSAEEVKKLKQVDLEVRHTGWVRCTIPNTSLHVIKLELKGPDNSLRLRQVKVLGEVDGSPLVVGKQASALVMQQKNCEAETLKVFRILTSEVFGKLIWDQSSSIDAKDELDNGDGVSEGDVDLKEHMVGILFSRSKLTHLQKQVCAHIVQAIRKETLCVKEEWETSLASGKSQVEVDRARTSDAYCFELLSMVLALSGSVVGRTYLAQQHSLLQDLLSLLHTASPRVQRQVTALLRRVLPDVPPQTLARLLEVTSLPPADFSILANTDKAQAQSQFDPDKLGILDVFLACIAKSITLQTKVKGQGGGKGASTSYRLTDFIPASSKQAGRWWLRGVISSGLASTIITLLKDLAAGQLSDAWSAVTKSAIAESILALTKLEDSCRSPTECINTPTLWLALASLCVLDQEHVDRLSSGQWVSGREQNQPKPTCDNHDDGETAAIILCNVCGNLCAECDRFLHLHRRTRTHQRQVFKEEEEAIKVDLHEGCGRIKLFWVTALTDSKTLKALVEFRQGKGGKLTGSKTGSGTGICRFCGASASNGLLAIGNVCSDPECQEHAQNACNKNHNCGHPCGGIKEEEPCLPCLHGCSLSSKDKLKQDADDMCMICFTEALSAAPAIQLKCGHVFHLHCCRNVLRNKWMGPRITFGFSLCPICKRDIEHSVLKELLEPIRALYQDVHRKALMRLEYEGLHKAEAITTQGTRFYNDPPGFAMDRYAYYVCFKCKKAYYGGEVRCEEQAAGGEDYDPAELVCGGCSDVSRAQMCPKHGTDFLEYKCRYCCSVAVFFCFGTTHFCNACHDDFQRVTNIPKDQLPRCPAGPKAKQLEGEECPLHVQHPATGEEFALGCGVCRNAHTF